VTMERSVAENETVRLEDSDFTGKTARYLSCSHPTVGRSGARRLFEVSITEPVSLTAWAQTSGTNRTLLNAFAPISPLIPLLIVKVARCGIAVHSQTFSTRCLVI
jgi:hypothetical protein